MDSVLRINTALSNKPFYVSITDPQMSMDRIFAEAISTLNNSGRPLEGQQLDQLYKQHQIFSNGKVIQKGDLFSELSAKTTQIGDHTVAVAEVDLVTSHSGGGIWYYAVVLYGVELTKEEVFILAKHSPNWPQVVKHCQKYRKDSSLEDLEETIRDEIDDYLEDIFDPSLDHMILESISWYYDGDRHYYLTHPSLYFKTKKMYSGNSIQMPEKFDSEETDDLFLPYTSKQPQWHLMTEGC